jgi:hypothetical protein
MHSNQLWLLWAGTSAQPTRVGWVQPCGWAYTGPTQFISFFFLCVDIYIYLKIVIFPQIFLRYFD